MIRVEVCLSQLICGFATKLEKTPFAEDGAKDN